LTERLQQRDAMMQGFVLDGFPKTDGQLQELERLVPSHIFVLECNDSLVVERLTARKLDPLTGVFYHNPEEVEDEVIKMRLKTANPDKEPVVKSR
jgi:adenylate kinase